MSQQNPTQMIPLGKLVKSAENARKTPPTRQQQDELKADIAARGLLQNLLVRSAARGKFEVIAGGRRLDALKTLQKAGKLPKTYKAPCVVRTDDPKEMSVAENVQRVAMHPADEFEAFAQMIDAGQSVADVAQRFGYTEVHIRQRLKLGKVAPELLQAYRDEEMSLDVLMAFTVSGDPDRQRAAWKEVKGHYQVSPYSVKRLLTENTVSAASPLGRFVGIEAYEQAGGAVSHDLFTDESDGYMDDPKIVRELAQQKLAAEAERLEQAGWKWAKPMIEPDYGFAADFDRVYPTPVDPPAKLTKELAKVNARYEEIEATADEDWTDELADESETLADRQVQLNAEIEGYAKYADEDMAKAGCVVTIGRDGAVEVHGGLIPRDETAGAKGGVKAVATGEGVTAGNVGIAGTPSTADPEPTGEQKVRKDCGLSQVHIDDLTAHRLQITKAHLAKDYRTAFDVALFSMCMSVLQTYARGLPLDLRLLETRMTSSLDDLKDTAADQMLKARRDGLSLAWLNLPADEAFDAMSALPAKDKQALFAWCVAQSLHGQLSFEDQASPVVEKVGERLKIPVAKFFRPTAEAYWSRIKMDHARAIGGEILGGPWLRNYAKAKKAQLAKALAEAFSGNGDVPGSVTAKARGEAAKWVPEGFAYEPRAAETEASPDSVDAQPVSGPVSGSAPEAADADEDLPEFLTGETAAEDTVEAAA
ncbi:MAG: hypothetical protein GKS00_02085 [Alphaproteobacteria bacterium]|nr:hypothetical protein [Alphaproteobacteria bacterium]